MNATIYCKLVDGICISVRSSNLQQENTCRKANEMFNDTTNGVKKPATAVTLYDY